MKQIVICVTGGHITPAIAVMEEIRASRPQWDLFCIGRKDVFDGSNVTSQEERLVGALGVPFYAISTGRLSRIWTPAVLLSLLKIPGAIWAAYTLLKMRRPDIILSFGGYIALPVVLVGRMLGIPTITHEQTGSLGLANRLIALMARLVLIARRDGIPLRRGLFLRRRKLPFPEFSTDTAYPLLYITGGSTGAQSLNALIYPIVLELIRSYRVIHQVGEAGINAAEVARVMLPAAERNRYLAVRYIDTDDLSWVYQNASLLVGRSGANTTAEAQAIGIPALWIPLPWSGGGEQEVNAGVLVSRGTAAVVSQHEASPQRLFEEICRMMHEIDRYSKAARAAAREFRRDGAAVVLGEVDRIAQ